MTRSTTNDMDDTELLGQFVESEQMYTYPTTTKFIAAVGTSRATLYKVINGGVASVRPQVIIAVERALGWPLGSIAAIRRHDLNWLTTKGFPPDAMERLRDEMGESEAGTG